MFSDYIVCIFIFMCIHTMWGGMDYMNNTNSDTHKTICSLILYSTAGVSMFLTCTFMYSLGKGAGLGMEVTFVIVGILFDVAKSYFPTLITKIMNKGHITALILGVITAAFVITSVAASVFSLQAGVQDALSQTRSAKVLQLQISSIKKEISDLELLKTRQLSVNHISKASNTALLISEKRDELNNTLAKSTHVSEDSLLSSFSTTIILIISVSLEVLSIAMALSLYHLKTNAETSRDIIRQDETREHIHVVETTNPTETSHVLMQNKTVKTSMSSTVSDTTYSALTTKEQIIADMRASLLKGECTPTHRSLYNAFRSLIKQKEVKSYLVELEQRNVIKPTGKGGYSLNYCA